MHSAMLPRWQHRRSRPAHGHSGHWRADSTSRTSSSATHPPPSPQVVRRALPRRIAMDLLGDATRDCVKRSMTSRPCWRPRGRREHLLRLMQPAGAAATTASRPTAWLASPLAERHRRGAASNFERSTHESAGRGRRRGRGLVVCALRRRHAVLLGTSHRARQPVVENFGRWGDFERRESSPLSS